MMKNIIHKVPFVRLLMALITGLLLGRYLNIPIDYLLVFTGLMVCASLIFTTCKRLKLSFRFRWVHGSIILCTFCLMGQVIFKLHEQKVLAMPASEQFYHVAILETPEVKRNSIFMIAKVTSWEHKISGKAILYLRKDSASMSLRAGDQLLIQCRFDSIPASGIPHGFDYAAWMHKRHIVSQAWASSDDWVRIAQKRQDHIIKFKEGIRDYANAVFKEKIDHRGYGLIMALIIGDKRYVDREQKLRFKRAGVLHVMAVSGLHVGILYVFLSGILFFLKRKKWLRILRSIVIWIVLALFAFVAGFSPSVVRAVWMFFLVDAGRLAAKKSSIYNIIAASAFVILLIDPHTVFEAGFWLSYCAVLSIITFFPYLKRLWNPSNIMMIKVRDLIALSLSVQPGTAPLSIFLFNQFPVWFLWSNLIAVPLVGLIINLSFVLVLLELMSVSMDWMFSCLQFLLDMLDYSLTGISKLPMAVITRISMSGFELTLLLVMASMVGWFLWMREKRLLIPLLLLFNVCMMSFTIRKAINLNTSELLVFSTYGNQGIFLRKGNTGCWIEEPSSAKTYNVLEKYIAINGIKHITRLSEGGISIKNTSGGSPEFIIKMKVSGEDIPELVRQMTGQKPREVSDICHLWSRFRAINASFFCLAGSSMPFLVLWTSERNETVLIIDNKGIREWSFEDSGALLTKKCIQNTK